LFLPLLFTCPAQNIKVNWATNNTGGMRKDTSSKWTEPNTNLQNCSVSLLLNSLTFHPCCLKQRSSLRLLWLSQTWIHYINFRIEDSLPELFLCFVVCVCVSYSMDIFKRTSVLLLLHGIGFERLRVTVEVLSDSLVWTNLSFGILINIHHSQSSFVQIM